MPATDVERADVYLNDLRVGLLERLPKGNRFTYQIQPPHPIAFNLPYRPEPYEQEGENLPPFFANLLPEGQRLSALIQRVRTSPSDMFSLLLEAGPDCVGDVYAVPEGQSPHPEPLPTLRSLKSADFQALFQEVLAGPPDVSISGVQEKLVISDAMQTLPIHASAIGSSILKLSPPNFPHIVENEALFLDIAKRCGFQVNSARIVSDRTGKTGLLVQRFDRLRRPGQPLLRIHQEDGCQLADRYPADKYRLSLRQIAESIQTFSAAPVPQILELIRRYAFAYLIGNADLHAKNVSLYLDPNSGLAVQTPLYDIVSTAAYAHLETRMAMKIDAKDDRFRLGDFVAFGSRFEVSESAIVPNLQNLASKLEAQVGRIQTLPYAKEDRERMLDLISQRLTRLKT